MKKRTRFSREVRESAVRKVFEQRVEHGSQWAAIEWISSKIGCSAQTPHNWVRQYERDTDQLEGVTTADAARIKALERTVRELHAANEILRLGSAYFAHDFIDVAIQQGSACVAFVIDVLTRHIVGWRVSRATQTEFVLQALE